MEFDPIPIGSCSKQHITIYQEWFNYADSGTIIFHYYLFIYSPFEIVQHEIRVGFFWTNNLTFVFQIAMVA